MKRIVLLEDEPDTNYCMTQLLKHFGYDVLSYAKPSEFLRNKPLNIYHIVTDFDMITENAYNTLAIRNVEYPYVNMTLTTGNVIEAYKFHQKTGIEYLLKPVIIQDLINKIERSFK